MSMSKREQSDDSLESQQKETAETKLALAQLQQLSKYLEGRILTICDASIADKVQVKAMKDLVRDAMRTFRFHAEMVASGYGDEYSIGVPTLDIKETDQGFAMPVLLPKDE